MSLIRNYSLYLVSQYDFIEKITEYSFIDFVPDPFHPVNDVLIDMYLPLWFQWTIFKGQKLGTNKTADIIRMRKF